MTNVAVPTLSRNIAPRFCCLPSRSVSSLALLAGLAGAAPARAQVPASEPVPQIVTSGRGEVRLAPDRAALSISVETHRPSAALASQENARLQRAVFDTLRAVGLTAEQLSTSDFSVVPEQRWNQQKQQSELLGYVVRNTIRVQVRQLDQLGRVIDGALAKGSNLISSLELYAANTEGARHEALAKAVERARADADVMAKAAGGTVSGLLELSTEADEPQVVRPLMLAPRASGAAAPETPIGTGSQTLNVRVTARWRFLADRR